MKQFIMFIVLASYSAQASPFMHFMCELRFREKDSFEYKLMIRLVGQLRDGDEKVFEERFTQMHKSLVDACEIRRII